MIIKALFLLVLFSPSLIAQNIQNDKPSILIVKEAINKMYNLENDASEKLAGELAKLHPDHPASSFIMALNIYWKEMPINNRSKNFEKFHYYLQETLDKSTKMLDKDKNDEEGIFFSLSAHGYLTQYYAEENSNFKAMKEAKNAYSFIKSGFDLTEKNPEFYYTTGIYNYYRDVYPDLHPVYKSFMWFFASGDKETGLQNLEKAIKKATFTKVEAINYSAHFYLRYEDAPSKSLEYSEELVAKFPGNLLYKAIFVEGLINLKRYDDAKIHVAALLNAPSHYFQMMGQTYMGRILEKQGKDLKKAKEFYLKSLETSKLIEYKASHYNSIAYCGLSRIEGKNGNKDGAKDYHKKASATAIYPSLKKEAEETKS